MPPADATEARQVLPRVLGPLAALSCIVGSVIGSGIFITPSRIAANVPYVGGIALVWVVGGLFSLAGALTLAELGAMLPQAGGPYVYLREAYGRLPAFLFGWSEFLVIRSGSVATLAVGFALYFTQLVPAPAGMRPEVWGTSVAVAAMITVAAINVVGTRVGGGVQVVGTAIKVAALAAMIVLPFVLGEVDPTRLAPAWPRPGTPGLLDGFLVALIGVLWSYDGWTNVGSLAEDFEDPGRNIPLALFRGMGILIAIYLGMTLVYHLVLPIDDVIRASGSPGTRQVAAEFCHRIWGTRGSTAIALIVMTSIYIALNGQALSGPRAYFAMARDGLFPASLSALHPRFRTPANAIVVQTLWAIALTVVGTAFILVEPPATGLPPLVRSVWARLHAKPLYDVLYTYVIFGGTIFYTAAIAGVFVLRRTRPDLPRPYRTWGYPVTPALYILASLVLMASMLKESTGDSLAGLGIILLGLPAYLFFTRRGPAPASPAD